MALYDYKCVCGHTFEVWQSMHSKRRRGWTCPECKSKNTERLLSMAQVGAIVGSGDATTILTNSDGSPYRLKAGTAKGQKKEILQELNKREEAKIASGQINPKYRLNYEVNG